MRQTDYDPAFETEVGERAARAQPALVQLYLHGRVMARNMRRQLDVERLLDEITGLVRDLRRSE